MPSYAVTLRCTKKHFLLSDYEVRLKADFAPRGHIASLHYEDTKGLHCHFILNCDTYIDYKDFYKRGWNALFKEIYYKNGWIRYTIKDKHLNVYEEHRNYELELFRPKISPPNSFSDSPNSIDSSITVLDSNEFKNSSLDIRKL